MKNALKHFHLVNKHRWYVFKVAVKAGIPIRGLLHDLSKYSFVEFFESIKYYDGHKSPIVGAKIDKGYSKAWLHHKGRNKHHLEYWEDVTKNGRYGIFLPYKYMIEALCDKIGAGMAYNRKNFNFNQPYEYWTNIEKNLSIEKHPGTIEFFDTMLERFSKEGFNVIKPKILKETYNNIYDKYFKEENYYKKYFDIK